MADRLDLDAIAADDALLDLLAAGGESAWEAGEYDPALKLLADLRIAVEVEDELPVETIDDPETFLARCAALNPVTDPLARKIAARGLALGVAAVAALSVSGVAAAVTGDPLSPYETVIEKVVDGLRPQTSLPKEQLDGMPPVNKTKVVKVRKDYREKQQQKQQAETDNRLNPNLVDPPQDLTVDPRPPLARPTAEKPITPEKPSVDEHTVSTAKPEVVKPTVQPTQTMPPPTDTPTPTPTETPPPTDTPTSPPTDTTTGPTGTTTDQHAVPEDTATGDTATGETSTGNTVEQPPSGTTGPQSDPVPNQPGTDSKTDAPADSTAGDQTTAPGSTTEPIDDTPRPGDTTPTDEQTKPTEPSPAGPSSTEQPRAESSEKAAHKSSAKHSNGKHELGKANAKYTTGKHSSGHYAEGKHAALSRAHGSTAPTTLQQIQQILVVINGVMEPVRTD